MLRNMLLFASAVLILAVSFCSPHQKARGAALRPMPYPEAIYFADDMQYLPCVYADVPDWLCSWVPMPKPDPRKTAAK